MSEQSHLDWTSKHNKVICDTMHSQRWDLENEISRPEQICNTRPSLLSLSTLTSKSSPTMGLNNPCSLCSLCLHVTVGLRGICNIRQQTNKQRTKTTNYKQTFLQCLLLNVQSYQQHKTSPGTFNIIRLFNGNKQTKIKNNKSEKTNLFLSIFHKLLWQD